MFSKALVRNGRVLMGRQPTSKFALRCMSTTGSGSNLPPVVPTVSATPVTPIVDVSNVAVAAPPTIPVVPEVPTTVLADAVDKVIPVLGNSPSDLVVKAIENLHLMLDVPYWQAIALFTVILRVGLSPINIGAIRNGARMAVARPQIDKLQKAMKADPRGQEHAVMQKYQGEMKAVFEKYQVNPLKSLVGPFVQIPVFMSMFFGIQKFADYYPDIASGGLLWFTDLSVQDPYYILPVLNAASFLAMIEIGADGMPAEQQGMFKWAMRGLSLFMIPFTIHLPTCVYVYWTSNNIISVTQTLALKRPALKKMFGIPEAPKATEQPAFKNKLDNFNPITSFINKLKEENAHPENEAAVIVDGSGSTSAAKSVSSTMPVGPPPKTFTAPPRRQKTSTQQQTVSSMNKHKRK